MALAALRRPPETDTLFYTVFDAAAAAAAAAEATRKPQRLLMVSNVKLGPIICTGAGNYHTVVKLLPTVLRSPTKFGNSLRAK
jgi:hypothetical protein